MFLGPMFVFFVVFLVFPVLGTVWWSTRSGSIFGGTQFVGLDNFLRLPDVVGAADRDPEHAGASPCSRCR